MNRKHNPWVALVALLLSIALVILCAGCGVSAEAAETTEPRFTCEYTGDAGGMNLFIITDTETGVQYLMAERYGHGYGIGLTALVEKEG